MTGRRQERGTKAHKAGHLGERLAALWLICKGYRILERRYKTPVGEIDLIARRGGMIVYVEVKARPDLEAALLAVSGQARGRISRAALWYSQKHDLEHLTQRFDLVAILPWRRPRHFENVWDQE